MLGKVQLELLCCNTASFNADAHRVVIDGALNSPIASIAPPILRRRDKSEIENILKNFYTQFCCGSMTSWARMVRQAPIRKPRLGGHRIAPVVWIDEGAR